LPWHSGVIFAEYWHNFGTGPLVWFECKSWSVIARTGRDLRVSNMEILVGLGLGLHGSEISERTELPSFEEVANKQFDCWPM